MLRQALLALCLTAPLALPAAAQDVDPTEVLVTADQLAAARKEADDLVTAGNCEAALPVLESLVKKANTHANLIYAGARSILENPRGNSVSTALENQMRSPLQAQVGALRVRNQGWISIAECMEKVGQPDAAAAAYLKALELIDASEERPTWDRARIGLWKLIGVIPQ